MFFKTEALVQACRIAGDFKGDQLIDSQVLPEILFTESPTFQNKNPNYQIHRNYSRTALWHCNDARREMHVTTNDPFIE